MSVAKRFHTPPQRRGTMLVKTVGYVAAVSAVLALAVAIAPTLRTEKALGAGRAEIETHIAVAFDLCIRGQGFNCVIDGDTIRYEGERIRLADIDTPETYRARCDSELALGTRAKDRLLQLVNAGPFDVVFYSRDRDRYGRKLRLLERHGASLGGVLVSEGLARAWDGARHPWCDGV